MDQHLQNFEKKVFVNQEFCSASNDLPNWKLTERHFYQIRKYITWYIWGGGVLVGDFHFCLWRRNLYQNTPHAKELWKLNKIKCKIVWKHQRAIKVARIQRIKMPDRREMHWSESFLYSCFAPLELLLIQVLSQVQNPGRKWQLILAIDKKVSRVEGCQDLMGHGHGVKENQRELSLWVISLQDISGFLSCACEKWKAMQPNETAAAERLKSWVG